MKIRRVIAAGAVFATFIVGAASPVLAHNEGRVQTGNDTCVDVGGGNNPISEHDGLKRGIHYASRQGNSAPLSGFCP